MAFLIFLIFIMFIIIIILIIIIIIMIIIIIRPMSIMHERTQNRTDNTPTPLTATTPQY